MSLPLDDRGLLLGDGLFETLLVIDGAPVWWGEHMARLRRGCLALGLPEPADDDALASARQALASQPATPPAAAPAPAGCRLPASGTRRRRWYQDQRRRRNQSQAQAHRVNLATRRARLQGPAIPEGCPAGGSPGG